jgi:hypothetical protein
MQFTQKPGYIAILSTIILLSIIIITLLSTQLISQQSSEDTLYRRLNQEAETVAESCLEDTLIRLRDNINYSGSALNISDGYCTISITDTGVNQKTIDIEANIFAEVYRSVSATIEIIKTDEITSIKLIEKTKN